jgi:hypothetical protein
VAVFIKDMSDRWQEFDRLADLGTDILDEPANPLTPYPTAPVPITIADRRCAKSVTRALIYDAGSR